MFPPELQHGLPSGVAEETAEVGNVVVVHPGGDLLDGKVGFDKVALELVNDGLVDEGFGGYNGVQIGTHFICTEESGIARKSKEVFVNAHAKDIVVIKSPVGLPVRVLRTPLVERVLSGNREKFTCPYHCLRTCNPAKSLFCIARALLATWMGDTEHGLYMCGSNIEAETRIYPLKEFFDTLKD